MSCVPVYLHWSSTPSIPSADLTEEAFAIDTDEESGQIVFRLEKPSEHDSFLLIQSLTLGLQEIMNQYGNELYYIGLQGGVRPC